MVRFSILVILFFSALYGEESDAQRSDEWIKIHSGEAQYDGKEFILEGHVSVQHGLGQISAGRLSLISASKDDKKNKFAFLTLSDNVQIELQGGGRLSCQRAEVDYAQLQAVFLGSDQSPDVIFMHTSPVIEMRSLKMTLGLARSPLTSDSPSKLLVQDIKALQSVRIEYHDLYYLTADQAHFQRLSSSSDAQVEGVLTLTMDQGSQKGCELMTPQGDRIQASCIRADLAQGRFYFERANGSMHGPPGQDFGSPIEFAADDIVWDDRHQTLRMDGHAWITHQGYGEVGADHLVIAFNKDSGHFFPDKIIVEGDVRLLNKFDGHLEESGSNLHYAWADRIEYSFKDHAMLLVCSDGKRVLLFDKVNNVQMSAPSLQIQRDATSGKQIIRGLGDVRFSFIEKEIEQLNQLFHFFKADSKEE